MNLCLFVMFQMLSYAAQYTKLWSRIGRLGYVVPSNAFTVFMSLGAAKNAKSKTRGDHTAEKPNVGLLYVLKLLSFTTMNARSLSSIDKPPSTANTLL